jgi:hypothetical protein
LVKGLLDDLLDKISDRIAYNVKKIFRNLFENFDEKAIMNFVEHMSIAQSGDVVELRISYDDIDELLEAAKAGMEVRKRLEKSMANIRTLGQAIEMYQMDHAFLPQTDNMEELAELLAPFYMSDKEAIKDGWGNLLVYQYSTGEFARDYTVMSYGADGEPGPDIPEEERDPAFINFEEDIIWFNGYWTKRPPELEFRY